MYAHCRRSFIHYLRKYTVVAVLGTFVLGGLSALGTYATEGEPGTGGAGEAEPCVLDLDLDYFNVTRTTIAPGESTTLRWKVVPGPAANPTCMTHVKLYLEDGGRSRVSKQSGKSVSPAYTTTYRLLLIDERWPVPSSPNQINLHARYFDTIVTVTVQQPLQVMQPITKVRVFVDVPAEFASYSGTAPVTFGVPFKKGVLNSSDPVRLIDSYGKAQKAEFQVTSTYGPQSEDVRWLLVDAIVNVHQGQGEELYLAFGPGVQPAPQSTGLKITQSGGVYKVTGGARDLVVTPQVLGDFVLEGSEGGETTAYSAFADPAHTVEIEKPGSVRATLKMSGHYRSAAGATLGEYITRYRFYAGEPYIRVYHTMIWDRHGDVNIANLRLELPFSSYQVAGEVAGTIMTGPSLDYTQIQHDTIHSAGGDQPGTLGGWIKAAGSEALFMSVRWPWQQYPVAIYGDHTKIGIRLLGPTSPMNLMPANIAATDELKTFTRSNWDIPNNVGPYRPMSPLGVGKTWELLVWFDKGGISDTVKNSMLQHPVIAYVDPQFSTLADLPSPISPYNPTKNPTIEGAIARAFDWVTKREAHKGDYGVWNFGDHQYNWNVNVQGRGHHRLDRYWLNHGKGWNLTPWLLYLRSGNRKYLEEGEAHSRHLMDVDTCHKDDPSLEKYKGGVTMYAPVHFGQHTYRAHFVTDSEYLFYYYYLTGYERAHDMINERLESLVSTTDEDVYLRDIEDRIRRATSPFHFHENTVDPELMISREDYGTIGELGTFYEYTYDQRVKHYGDIYIDILKNAQADTGYMAGIKTAIWFSHSMNVFQRAFDHRRAEIRQVLQKWTDYKGLPSQAGTTGHMEGAYSMWNWVTLAEATGDDHSLREAIGAVRAQAASIEDGETYFRGYSMIDIFDMGPAIRDWVAVMAAAADRGLDMQSYAYSSLPYFNGSLTTRLDVADRWKGRHVAFVGVEQQTSVAIDVDYNFVNAGRFHNIKVLVIAPSGQIILDQDFERHNFEGAGPRTWEGYMSSNHFTLEEAATLRKPFRFTFTPSEGAGAYAIEIYSKQLELAFSVRSSTGKVVHYFPSYGLRAAHVPSKTLYFDYGQYLPSVSGYASTIGGAFWVKPKTVGAEERFAYARVVYHVGHGLPEVTMPEDHPLSILPRLEAPRVTAEAASGQELCHTSITGVNAQGNPTGTECVHTATSDELHPVITANSSGHHRLFLNGVHHYISATKDEWFNPEDVAHPEFAQFLVPRL